MSEQENSSPPLAQDAKTTGGKAAATAKKCCCSVADLPKLAAVFAIATVKGGAVLLCAASVVLSLVATVMCIPAIGWMMRVAVFGGGSLSALFVMDDLALPPFALLMLYCSITLLRRTMALLNSNPEVQKVEDAFRFACCGKPKCSGGAVEAPEK